MSYKLSAVCLHYSVGSNPGRAGSKFGIFGGFVKFNYGVVNRGFKVWFFRICTSWVWPVSGQTDLKFGLFGGV